MRAPMENNWQWEIPNASSERKPTNGREIQPCFPRHPQPCWRHNGGVDNGSTGNERHEPTPNSMYLTATPVDPPSSSAPYLTGSPSPLAVVVPDPYPYPYRPSHAGESAYGGRLARHPNTITASLRQALPLGPTVDSRIQWATGARKTRLNGGGDEVFRSSCEESSSCGKLTAVVDFTVQEERLFRDEWRLCAEDMEAVEDHLLDALNRILNVDIVMDCIDTIPTSCTRCRSDTAVKTDAAHLDMPLLVTQHYSLQSSQEEAITNGFHALGCAAAPNVSVPQVAAQSQVTVIDTISFRVNAIRWFIQHYEELTTQVSQIEYRQDCLRQQVHLTPSSSAISAGGSTMADMNCNTTTLMTTSTTTTPMRGMKMDVPCLGPRLSTLRDEISPFLLQEVWPICPDSASCLDVQVGRATSSDANARPVSLFPVSLSFFEEKGLSTVEKEMVRDTVFCSAARGALIRMLREIREMVTKMQLAIQPLTLAIGFTSPSTATPSLLPPSLSTGLGQPADERAIAMANEVLQKMSSVTLNRHQEHLERTVLKAHKQRQVLKEWAETAGVLLPLKREQTTEGRKHWRLSSPLSGRLQGFLRDIGGAHPELQWEMRTSLPTDSHDKLGSICSSDWHGAIFHQDAYPLPPCPDGPVMAPKRLSRYHTQKSPPRRSAKRYLGSSTRNRNNTNAVNNEDHCSLAQRSEGGRFTKWFDWWGDRKRTREDEHHKDKKDKKAAQRQPFSYPASCSSSGSHPMKRKKRRERNDERNSKKTTSNAKTKSPKRRNNAFPQVAEEVLLLTESESSREPSQLFSSRGSRRKYPSRSSLPKDMTLSPSESDCPSSLSREPSSCIESSDVIVLSSNDKKMLPAGGRSFTKSHSEQVNQKAVKRTSDEVGPGLTSSSFWKRSRFHKDDDDGDEHEKVEFGLRAGTSVWRAIPAFFRSVKDRAISFSDSESDETDSE